MNLEIRTGRLATLLLVLMTLLSTWLVYWQVIRGQALAADLNNPIAALHNGENLISGGNTVSQPEAADNPPASAPVIQRAEQEINAIQRGSILDRNGHQLAHDERQADGSWRHVYDEPSLAHVIGVVSGLGVGISGLEKTYNETLLGLDRPRSQVEQLLNQPLIGSNLTLSIDLPLQQAADQMLQGKRGAILVLDGHSGAVLAMASEPRYDPNRVNEPGYLDGLIRNCSNDPQCAAPFLNRATQALYPPGSTFKTVTLIAALETGQVNRETMFNFGKAVRGPNGPIYVYHVGGGEIPDPNHRESRLNLEMSYAKSANYAFAQIGDQMDPDIFINYATRFGFSNPQPFSLEIESSPAQLAINPDALRSDSLLRASTAIGQGEALASPLEMGMVVLSVLNNGDLPLPYFVQSIQSPAGKPMNIDRNRQILRGLMHPETAEEVHDMMVSVVQRGSGARAAIQGVQVGGKTGTAQVGGSQAPHAWFTGFAEKDGHSVVVVVLIENGGEGGSTAAPIFASIARLALKNSGISDMPDASLETQPTQEPTCQEADGVLCPDVLRDPLKVELDQTSIPGTCHIDHEGPVGSGVFEWPTDAHGVVGSNFTTDHPAVDLGAQADTPVKAADAGLVVFAGWTDVGYGNAIVINHGNGYRTLYAHLGKLLVRCGQDVKSGQTIGLAGDTGFTGGPHLHFEIRVRDGFIDPWKLLPNGD